jgi:type I restriction enzyme, S subunit
MSARTIDFGDISGEARWDPEYYGKNYATIRDRLTSCGALPLSAFVLEANRGIGPRYDEAGSVRVINSVNVRDLELSEERQSRVTAGDLSATPAAAVYPGDLMVTSTGIGTLGRVFCNLSEETYFADGHITVLRLKDKRAGAYLCAFLQSAIGRIQFIQRRRGSSRQVEVYPEDILSVLVPTLPEFRERIAQEWLNNTKRMALANSRYPAAESKMLAAIGWDGKSANFAGNVFATGITDMLTTERCDPEFFAPMARGLTEHLKAQLAMSFGELVLAYVNGVQPSSYTLDGEVIVVKSKDVTKAGINIDMCERVRAEHLDGDRGFVHPGTLVMNMTGVGTLGRVSVIPKSTSRIAVSVDVSGWTLGSNGIPAEYVSLFLNSPIGMSQSTRYQTGSSWPAPLISGARAQFIDFR